MRCTKSGRGWLARAGLLVVLVALFCGAAAQAALAIAPAVEKVTPAEGPAAGGTEVAISGHGFESVTGVKFGSTAAIKYKVTSSTKITAEAPTHADGTVNITVEAHGEKSEITEADEYRFTGALPKAPENVIPPEMSPEPPVENTPESVTTGTWTNLPSSYKYEWKHCNVTTCGKIEGATKSTYSPPYKYVGETLKVSVTAENAGGQSKPVLVASIKTVVSNGVVEYATGFEGLEGIAPGPEEHMWFTATTASVSGLGVMTTTGSVLKEITLSKSFPEAIAEGPDHNLWFTEWNTSKIGKITPSGTVTEYELPAQREPYDIVKGPDGNMWFTEQGQGTSWGKIGKITTAGVITEYALPEEANHPVPVGIVSGPEESLWFTLMYDKGGAARIDKITTSGTVTEHAVPKCTETFPYPEGIAEGPDGNLWYAELGCDIVGKMTPAGVFTEYKAGPGPPRDIASGPDGDVWYTSGGHVTKMTTAGVISTEYALQASSSPKGITVGPDKKMWVAAGTDVATIEP